MIQSGIASQLIAFRPNVTHQTLHSEIDSSASNASLLSINTDRERES
jgi:hypothetical protein